MIQDRLKIKKLRAGDLAPDVMLGRQTLLNCAAFKGWGQGCDGGEPLEVGLLGSGYIQKSQQSARQV
jgi:hypothetical protein